MPARVIDGAAIARGITEELRVRVARFAAAAGRPPTLGIVLVGEQPSSLIYVRNKNRTADALGIKAEVIRVPASSSIDEVLGLVDRLNQSSAHDAILVQAPLPDTIAAGTERVFERIDPAKDVDGFHPVNVGRLVQNRATLVPCTPAGIIEMLEREGVRMRGARAVVIGRSGIVGKPIALLLLHRDATVTICHSKTPDVPRIAASADILVAAIGRAAFVTPDFVKPGAVVVDVGINRVTDAGAVGRLFGAQSPRLEEFGRRGAVIVGDVHPDVADVAGAMTPVPGGVGPLTIAMLMKNTVTAAERRWRGGT
ncbi:MAG: bifunctional 5,10-methylenetetrahydrofolate dehydrogenase/5,10-methenyltetrahydrofolate cyclohydrolase [Acidobacteria bacterium]|nr:bifunctional 5,10-methylenetetrahydrofolate dehydrogenase/5,10-methenyltetrahydrofolate cyclohydrolase [Acidobacteriota bacterium]